MTHRPFTVPLAIMLLPGITALTSGDAGAAESAPPPEVKTAIAKRDKAAEAAAQAYWKALVQANRQLLADLDVQLKGAMRGNDPNKVVGIKAAIDRAKEEFAKAEAKTKAPTRPVGPQVKVEVLGNKPWQPFGAVRRGDVLIFTAEGTWSADARQPAYTVGPAGGLKGDTLGHLEGRIGEDGVTFRIGTGTTYTVPADGVLFLQMHDAGHVDNGGQITVTIEKQ